MENTTKTAVLLINVGTPDKPEVKQVRKYLFRFLNDRRVIDLPWLFQKLLVNLIIVPIRAPKSTKLYKMLWDEKGSPLLYHSVSLAEKLNKSLNDKADVFLAMRYGNPSIKRAIKEMKAQGYSKILIMPMFPQYAMSTSETAIVKVQNLLKYFNYKPELKVLEQFYEHPAFVDAFARRIASYGLENYDHLVFTYHGLPNRHLDKSHPGVSNQGCTCESEMPEHGAKCYKATCYATTRLLVKQLKLKPGTYSVGFQSRLSNNWMTPFTDALLGDIAKRGVKKVLVAAPSFVADCLETTVEIGMEYKEQFDLNGGEKLSMVESLNDSDLWVDALSEIIQPNLD